MSCLSLGTDRGATSFGRAANTPRRSPTRLRIRLIVVGLAGSLVLGGVGALVTPWLDSGWLYPWKAAAVFMVMMGIAARFVDDHPFARLGVANGVTCVRAMLVALVCGLIGESPQPRIAVAVIVLTGAAAILDGIDGWLARRTGLSSRFGARFDMETDALFATVLSILVWRHGRAGVWILLGGLLRYGFAAAGWVLPWMARPLAPTRRGRTIAIVNVVGLAIALAPVLPVSVGWDVAAATLAGLTWSFMVDVGRLHREK